MTTTKTAAETMTTTPVTTNGIELWLELRKEMRELTAQGAQYGKGREYPNEQFEKVLDVVEKIAANSMSVGMQLGES